MSDFSIRLRQRAEQLQISNAEAARRAGLSERRYGHYISGIREPDLTTLVRIARALASSPDWLLGFTDENHDLSRSGLLRDRALAAASALPDKALEIVVIQLEALVASGRPRKSS